MMSIPLSGNQYGKTICTMETTGRVGDITLTEE
jgi:hypothetical protein